MTIYLTILSIFTVINFCLFAVHSRRIDRQRTDLEAFKKRAEGTFLNHKEKNLELYDLVCDLAVTLGYKVVVKTEEHCNSFAPLFRKPLCHTHQTLHLEKLSKAGKVKSAKAPTKKRGK